MAEEKQTKKIVFEDETPSNNVIHVATNKEKQRFKIALYSLIGALAVFILALGIFYIDSLVRENLPSESPSEKIWVFTSDFVKVVVLIVLGYYFGSREHTK